MYTPPQSTHTPTPTLPTPIGCCVQHMDARGLSVEGVLEPGLHQGAVTRHLGACQLLGDHTIIHNT